MCGIIYFFVTSVVIVMWNSQACKCAEALVLTSGVASPCPSGLVPDRQAILQEAEVPLLLPGAGLDLSQSRPCHHHLDMGIILDTCAELWKVKVITSDAAPSEVGGSTEALIGLFLPLLIHQTLQTNGLITTVTLPSRWTNNIYSHEPSGSIISLESCQWGMIC